MSVSVMVSNRVRVSIWAISSLNYCFCCFVLVANLRCHLASNIEHLMTCHFARNAISRPK